MLAAIRSRLDAVCRSTAEESSEPSCSSVLFCSSIVPFESFVTSPEVDRRPAIDLSNATRDVRRVFS